jgi:hypothetical protein
MILKKIPARTMEIHDLSYLQCVPQDELILGSIGVSVTSEAFALGSNSSTFAIANTSAKALSIDVFTATGTGLAGAFGDDFTANVTAVLIRKSKFIFPKKTAIPSDFVVAIDLL